jgi:predicted ribosome-associated RNA-binding protein Tma20
LQEINADQDIYLKSITHVRMLAVEVSERNSVELKEKDRKGMVLFIHEATHPFES